MAAPYSVEKKIEILTYAKEHGVAQAAKHFNLHHAAITRWNTKLKIYPVQAASYPIEKRYEVLEYAAKHTIQEAANKFGVSRGTIEGWNRKLKVYSPKQRTFSHENKLEILYYARDYGTTEAANKYDVSDATIVEWNNKLHIYQPQKKYTEEEKKKILRFARENGVCEAEKEFDVPETTMFRWNKKYNIYTLRPVPDYVEYSDKERVIILKRAKKLYDQIRDGRPSANQAFALVTEEYDVTVEQLRKWNKKYHIVPLRPYKKRQIGQIEINDAQTALTAAKGRITRAARQSGMTQQAIKKLKADKKISFEKGKTRLSTNPPAGRQKSKAISAILQMLLTNQNKEGKE